MTRLDKQNLSQKILSDEPPTYDEVIAGTSCNNQMNAFLVQPQEYSRQYASFVDQTIPPPADPTLDFYPSRPYSHSFFAPMHLTKNWVALAYLIFWDVAFASFCMGYVIATFVAGMCLLIIPPIGYVFLLGSIYSWRMLARLDLMILNAISPYKILDPVSLIPPITKTSSHAIPPEGNFRNLFNLWFDGFTMRGVAYFVFIKFTVSLISFVLVIVSFALGVAFILCGLPLTLTLCAKLVEWQGHIARKVLLD